MKLHISKLLIAAALASGFASAANAAFCKVYGDATNSGTLAPNSTATVVGPFTFNCSPGNINASVNGGATAVIQVLQGGVWTNSSGVSVPAGTYRIQVKSGSSTVNYTLTSRIPLS